MDKNYGGVIWTNHALERLTQRGIKQGDAWATFMRPDQHRKGQAPGSWISYKTYGNEKIDVVAKKNDDGKWIILSVWSRPVFSGNPNSPPKTKSSGILKILKFILNLK